MVSAGLGLGMALTGAPAVYPLALILLLAMPAGTFAYVVARILQALVCDANRWVHPSNLSVDHEFTTRSMVTPVSTALSAPYGCHSS